MNYYPLKLKPYYKDVLWGGTALKKRFKKDLPTQNIGEAWELSARSEFESVIQNGEYENKTLREYLSDAGENPDSFPLLVKFIDANQDLSVQVHETKTEMWYIIDAQRGAKLVLGLNDETNFESLFNAINDCNEKKINSNLKYVNVHPGEIYFIPRGLIHAIGSGILLAEIQENDDSTYRIYDYDRKDKNGEKRELHLEKAKEVVKNISEAKIYSERFSRGRLTEKTIVNCNSFCVERQTVRTSVAVENSTYTHILCIDGDGEVSGVPIKMGESILIPKGMDNFVIKANRPLTLLISRAQ